LGTLYNQTDILKGGGGGGKIPLLTVRNVKRIGGEEGGPAFSVLEKETRLQKGEDQEGKLPRIYLLIWSSQAQKNNVGGGKKGELDSMKPIGGGEVRGRISLSVSSEGANCTSCGKKHHVRLHRKKKLFRRGKGGSSSKRPKKRVQIYALCPAKEKEKSGLRGERGGLRARQSRKEKKGL